MGPGAAGHDARPSAPRSGTSRTASSRCCTRSTIAPIGLEDFGKPGNYIGRQVERWSKQYRASETQRIEAMDNLIDWLPKNIPPEAGTTVVHGDFRLDNTIFHPTEPRILAVLDWELSTLGDPLADFAYHCMSWHIPPDKFRGIAGLADRGAGHPVGSELCEALSANEPAGPQSIRRTGTSISPTTCSASPRSARASPSACSTAPRRASTRRKRRARPCRSRELGWQQAEKILRRAA